MSDLSNKVAFVTNGDSAIARACVDVLSAAGAKVCVADRGAADLTVKVDMRDPDSWDAAYTTCIEELGGLDVLVIPTPAAPSSSIEDMPFQDFVESHRSMAIPTFLAQNRGILAMRGVGKGGAIVHVIPAAARAGLEGAVAACTASAGILFSSKSAALECAKAKDGIVVNTVLVGPVAGEPPLPYPNDLAAVPPQSIADAVLFYATDGAVYMSGMDLPVDNGFLAG